MGAVARGGLIPPPVAYQGGKVDLAQRIVDFLPVERGQTFCELCCGSGAVSLELIARGKAPSEIVMVDAGPWGAFYAAVGSGTFDLDRLRALCDSLPTDQVALAARIREIAASPVREDELPYTFLVLQAASFGGKAVWTEGERWRTSGVRTPWEPDPSRPTQRKHGSPVCSPTLPTVLERVERIVARARGVRAFRGRVEDFTPPPGSLVYIDPPYDGTTGYGYTLAIEEYVAGLDVPCFVSEARAVSDRAFLIQRRPGAVLTSASDSAREEWLSAFGEAAPVLQLFPEGLGV